jgi:hypothetical protein
MSARIGFHYQVVHWCAAPVHQHDVRKSCDGDGKQCGVATALTHLLQNSMVYINTLMLQQVLAQPQWSGKLTARDLRALTLRIWEHVNPYGRFELDMEARLPIH